MAKAPGAVLLLFLAATIHAVEVDPAGGMAEIEGPADPFCKRPIYPSTGICRSTTNISAVTDSLIIIDNGNITASYQLSNSTQGVIASGSLNSTTTPPLLYGQQCLFLWASVTITARRTPGIFASPRINQWLTQLGLANVQVMTGALTFQLTHTPMTIPNSQSPIFFTALQQAQAISIFECADCAASTSIRPAFSRLVALPGLSSFQKAWNFPRKGGAVTSITVQGTAFMSFAATFPGMQCSPGLLEIVNNPYLVSLSGLDNLTTTIRPGPTVIVSSNPLLNSSASVAALTGLAGCTPPSTASPLSSNISIQTIPLCVSTCWNQFCGFVNAGTCAPCASPPPQPPPPPPPPPVVDCRITPPASLPVCGSVGGLVQVTDNGDGTCSAFTSEIFGFTPIPNCASLAYPSWGICSAMRSHIKITIRRASTAVPYVQPDINKWLSQMGLNNISVSQGSLTVEVDHSSNPIPPTIAPNFLPTIRQVGALLVYECANCSLNPDIVPTTPALAGLPGLSNLAYIRGPGTSAQPFGSVIIRGTAFTDLSTLSGLTCPAGYFQITDNRNLQSFNGLQRVQRAPLPVNVTVIATGNPLPNWESVNQITKLADCPPPATSSTQLSAAYINTLQCTLPDWNLYCAYVNDPAHPCN